MSTDANKNEELVKTLKSVINVLQDGQKGFADLGEHLKDDTLKRYFLAESLKRANFRPSWRMSCTATESRIFTKTAPPPALSTAPGATSREGARHR